jgi:pheromone shutdown protein TraB
MMGNFILSEFVETLASFRPIVLLNHTNVTTVDMTPTVPTTSADMSISFGVVFYDYMLMFVSVFFVWSVSNGSISSTGVFTPYASGQHTVSVCFGIICATEIVTVTPGAPITLIAVGSVAEITADDTMSVTAYVVDQFGNIVPNQAITYTPSNGSMDLAQPNLFLPHATGF